LLPVIASTVSGSGPTTRVISRSVCSPSLVARVSTSMTSSPDSAPVRMPMLQRGSRAHHWLMVSASVVAL
jgi:hypothetical protein